MLQLLRDHVSRSAITLNIDFQRALNWFNTFLSQYNGVTFYDQEKPHHTVYLDVCLTGFGGSFQDMVYTLDIPLGYNNYTIVHCTRLSILVPYYKWMPVHLNHTKLNQCI